MTAPAHSAQAQGEKIARYNLVGYDHGTEPAHDGGWVRYSDVAPLLARLSPAEEDEHQELHLYSGDSAFVVRENGNKTLHGVQLPELLALFAEGEVSRAPIEAVAVKPLAWRWKQRGRTDVDAWQYQHGHPQLPVEQYDTEPVFAHPLPQGEAEPWIVGQSNVIMGHDRTPIYEMKHSTFRGEVTTAVSEAEVEAARTVIQKSFESISWEFGIPAKTVRAALEAAQRARK